MQTNKYTLFHYWTCDEEKLSKSTSSYQIIRMAFLRYVSQSGTYFFEEDPRDLFEKMHFHVRDYITFRFVKTRRMYLGSGNSESAVICILLVGFPQRVVFYFQDDRSVNWSSNEKLSISLWSSTNALNWNLQDCMNVKRTSKLVFLWIIPAVQFDVVVWSKEFISVYAIYGKPEVV